MVDAVTRSTHAKAALEAFETCRQEPADGGCGQGLIDRKHSFLHALNHRGWELIARLHPHTTWLLS
jgi:hypothetical protein